MPDMFYSVPTEIIYGIDVVNRVGSVVSEYGERALVVTEGILYETKTIERVLSILDKRSIQHIVSGQEEVQQTGIGNRTINGCRCFADGAVA